MADEGGCSGLYSKQACACCRVKRQRCDPTGCETAPYFPIEKLEEFKSAQRLFGVSNIQKIIHEAEEGSERKAAADSVLFEATARKEDPVRGSFGVLRAQRAELRARVRELEAARHCLDDYRRMDPALGPEERVEALLAARAAGRSGGGDMAAPAPEVSLAPAKDESETETVVMDADMKEDGDLMEFYDDLDTVNKMLESFEQAAHGENNDEKK